MVKHIKPRGSHTRLKPASARIAAVVFVVAAAFYLMGPSASVRAFPADRPAEDLPGGAFPGFLPVIFRNFQVPSVYGVEMSTINSGTKLNLVKALGSYWMRNNGLLWSSVEPVNNGVYDWGTVAGLEAELLATRQAGMQTILIVRSTPTWAQLIAGEACGPMKQAFFDDFGDFLVAAVKRYSGPPYYVRHFEIWNEPDVDPSSVPGDQIFGCWGDKNDEYFGGRFYGDMLEVVYPMMKNANNGITVLVGGLLLDCDPEDPPAGKDCTPSRFLEGILEAGAKNAFDGVSFHAYDFYSPTFDTFGNPNWHSGRFENEPNGVLQPVLIEKANFISGVLNSFGATGKILMNTEGALLCGSADDPPGQPPCDADDDSPFEVMKMAYAAQVFPAAIAEDMTANLWFTVMGWRNSGLINSNNTVRPAYLAFDFSEEMLAYADFKGNVTGHPNVMGYKFKLPTGSDVWIVWATNGGPQVMNLTFVPVSIWDATGDSVTVTGTTVTLTEEPFYLELP